MFSIVTLLGELAYGDSQPSSTVHTTVGMETYIHSIFTELGDLAPDDNNHTAVVKGKHIFHCHSAR